MISKPTKSLTPPTIYLLDDDSDFVQLFKTILTRLGTQVEAFSKAEDLLARIRVTRPTMAIIDLHLEGNVSGFDVIQQILGLKLIPFPILVVSADASPVSIAHALEIGASDYLTKPLDREVLASKLLNFLSSEKLEEASWAFRKGPEARFSAAVELEMQIREVDEFGVKVATRHLLGKGTAIMVSGDFFQKLFNSDKARILTVASSWVETSENLYGSYLEFDPTDDALIRAVQMWVANA